MVYYLLLPKWWTRAKAQEAGLKFSIRGGFSPEKLAEKNEKDTYNVYYLPNYPSKVIKGRSTNGRDVDVWNWVFVDMDLKEQKWPSKEAFLEEVKAFPLPPTAIVDSGNGIHVYWRVTDLDAMSYLRLQRRLAVRLKTDPTIANMHQLMRVPGTMNTKNIDRTKWVRAELLESEGHEYDSETISKAIPPITVEDEAKCKEHYETTMLDPSQIAPKEAAILPPKWFLFLKKSAEAKRIFNYENVKDRSTADFRLAHLLLAADFTRDEARAVLMNTGKALERNSIHQYSYAEKIVNKLWEKLTEDAEAKKPAKSATPMESTSDDAIDEEDIGQTVSQIIKDSENAPNGTRFPCHEAIDATFYGYRLGEWMGLVGGSGAGKTTFCLNMFKWFFERNPEYLHVFVTLEQTPREIGARWKRMAGDKPHLHSSVYVVGNYDKQGRFRNLGFKEITAYVKKIEKKTGKKVGCVVIDHIAIMNYERETKEMKDKLSGLCEQSKQFAIETSTFTIMQSQTSRVKAGVGDLELDKDAAYGTGYFEFYADYIVTTWQPLKRLYGEPKFSDGAMYINCWKYCKIRNKLADKDKVQEDQVYAFKLDLSNDCLRPLSEDNHESFNHLAKKATTIRNRDKKTNPAPLRVINWTTPVEQST